MSEKKVKRRDFLFTATYAVGAVGAAAVVWPMIDQMNPDASVKALASTEVDISSMNPGKTITVLWRGKPVFIRRRTQEEITEAKAVKLEDLKHPLKKKGVFVDIKSSLKNFKNFETNNIRYWRL